MCPVSSSRRSASGRTGSTRCWPYCDRQFLAVGAHRGDRRGFDQPQLAGQRSKGIGQQRGLLGQPGKVAGAGVDRAPRLDLREHRGGIDRVEQRGFGWGQAVASETALAEQRGRPTSATTPLHGFAPAA